MGRKVAVIGPTCSGKTTLARRLAKHYGVPHIELDAFHWGPNWTERDPDEFRHTVEAAMLDSGWVVDGNYGSKLGDLVIGQADLVVWLDPPLHTIVPRLWTRTLRRIRHQDDLWGNNRETWRGAFLSRDSLFVWALKTHRRRRRASPAMLEHVCSVRLRSAREADAWLEQELAASP
jgi:adenylate kinase family enzyme